MVKSADFDERNPKHFEVEKMKWRGKRPHLDKTPLRFNRYLALRGIPMECHNYRLGARSALDWIVDRYKVKTDKRSQIRKNPNQWNAESDGGNAGGSGADVGGRYIFELVQSIANLSLQTRQITNEEL